MRDAVDALVGDEVLGVALFEELASVVTAFLITSCASNELYLASYSRAAIDASTDGAGIGVKSGYLHLTPTRTDGSPYTVLGNSDIDLSVADAIIDEVLATGAAAVCASLPKQASTTDELSKLMEEGAFEGLMRKTQDPKRPSLIFGSYHSVSLIDLSWADASAKGITFGYKRATGLKIPVANDANDVGPAYARITVNTTEEDGSLPTQVDGMRSTHTFATGMAAVIKASLGAQELNGIPKGTATDLGCYQP